MPRTVLLIDDDRLQHRITQAHFGVFQGEKFSLEWAATYEEGLEKLAGGGFAACLLDYQLGERDGLELIREAIGRDCRTPIVFLTAETADRVDIAAMHAGALDYLVKGEITARALERSLRYALKLGETLEALRLLATRDELTGLLNRREFDRVLHEERERALRFGHPLGLIMIDVDRFKAINDGHGHLVGDAVLREVGRLLLREVRTVDRVARFGGEEFAVLLVQTDAASTFEVAARLCATIAGESFTAAGVAGLRATISVGVATLPNDVRPGGDLVAAADKALYAAKERGRNRVVAFAEI
ncbi:MAG: diguanylate cyclase [Opitutaceae bacterium]